MTRHLLTLLDLEREELLALLARGDELARLRGRPEHPRPLAGKSVVVLLEKASTRTRLSFEVGIAELGGHPLTLISRDTQLGRGSPSPTPRACSRATPTRSCIAPSSTRAWSSSPRTPASPVINGLSDDYHPCQLLADLMTVRAEKGRLEGVRVAWIGDGNNMAHSWILAAARTGLSLVLACPEGYEPKAEIVERARALGGDVTVLRDPMEAAEGADVVTTDVWASMGQEAE
ncbi:MAG: ornithine carbamoyltransferase, partial [Sandaracinaceae bacterium]|nr:ornithine carbamoyltransferase [Sandaracinaceae bacterium]